MITEIDPKNPPAVHEWTGPTGVKFRDVREPSGTYYHDTTPRAVIDALEAAMRSGDRVRLWLGDRKTGRDWHQEFDVTGTVGRSTGWLKTALLIPTARSMGGGAILADCIVCLRVAGREVYRHPGFSMPGYSIGFAAPGLRVASHQWEVTWTGETSPHARFKTRLAAQRYVAFMRGERAAK